ncbi:6-bladed beta-propeller [Acanthopleuribacter pedis]|uniref:6-bladed beta-propeller n=1 Tax=Acanthopleuribacter pedis TaxID=442870 RepID=A0A8J7Q8M6_9BACT|nr:6-bladed beta-propeller [Acanthopleuribacter pedis]MBO1319449.1 hypothetical protein [Acanthopleuribacter pedis]
MSLVIFLSLLLGDFKDLNLADHEVFQPDIATIHRVGNTYLLSSPLDHALLLFDENGKVRQGYLKPGQGPGELQHPTVFGVSPTQLFIQNSNKKFLVFDHKLNYLGDNQLPKLPFGEIGMTYLPRGIYLGENRFQFFAQFTQSTHYQLTAKDDQWQVKAFLPLEDHRDGVNIIQHAGHFFVSPSFQKEERYHIRIYTELPQNETQKDAMVQVLSGPIDTFPLRKSPGVPFTFRSILQTAAKTKDGYIAEIKANNKGFDNYWDYFDQQGRFIKREPKEDAQLVPVFNSSDVFAIKDGEHLIKLP